MVIVYGKEGCPQCTATTRWCAERGIKPEYRDVNEPRWEAAVRQLGYLGVPVVVTETESWKGFRPDKLADLAVRS